MDAFEDNLQTFSTTIYGKDMRDSLNRCFSLLYTEITNYSDKIQSANYKITELERGD